MIKENNWLNTEENRLKIKLSLNTEESRLKSRNSKLGDKNPMFGKKSWNNLGLRLRNKWGNADRGFNWRTIRQRIKGRDNYTCQMCGETEKDTKQYLQVHHLVRYSISKDNSDDNLITLCPKCHANSEPQFLRVTSIKKISKPEVVYNFEVEDDNTYLAEGIIVHNCRCTIVPEVELL